MFRSAPTLSSVVEALCPLIGKDPRIRWPFRRGRRFAAVVVGAQPALELFLDCTCITNAKTKELCRKGNILARNRSTNGAHKERIQVLQHLALFLVLAREIRQTVDVRTEDEKQRGLTDELLVAG